MVVAQGQPNDVADGNGVTSILIGNHHWFFEDAAHAQDRNLGLQDDGRTKLRAEDSGVGNGDGASLDLVQFQLFAAGPLSCIRDGPLQTDKA